MRKKSLLGLTLWMGQADLLRAIPSTSLASLGSLTEIVLFWELSTSPSLSMLSLMEVALIPYVIMAVPMLGYQSAVFLQSTLQISRSSLSSGP